MATYFFWSTESGRNNTERLQYVAFQRVFETGLCYTIDGGTCNYVTQIRIPELTKPDGRALERLFDDI